MLRINISELKTVRITCMKCKRGVIEVPVSRLGNALDHGRCRLCDEVVLPDHAKELLSGLRLAIEELGGHNPHISVEFEIPAPAAASS